MQFRKKPVVIEATQWFKNGDHPLDHAPFEGERTDTALKRYDDYKQTEGKIVRHYRHPYVSEAVPCKHCGGKLQTHGWVDTLEGGHIVCPGDWIITGVNGEHYPCKPDIFAKTYEAVEAEESADVALTGLTFGAALELLKGGAKVARTGWLDKGKYVELIRGAYGPAEISTFFAAKSTHSSLYTWHPDAADCLATDWAVWSTDIGEPDGRV